MRRAATKARAALMVALIGLSAAGLLFGRDADPCREAYQDSGLTQRGVGFEECRRSYSDVLCSKGGFHALATGSWKSHPKPLRERSRSECRGSPSIV